MEKLVKHEQPADTTSHSFLTGAILFANIDPSGLPDYAVKAAIGGAIWMIFKLAGDYISYKLTSTKKTNDDDSFDGKEEQ